MDVHVDYFHELIKQEWGYSCYKNEFDDAQLDIKAANSDVAGSIRYISDIDKLADHPEVTDDRKYSDHDKRHIPYDGPFPVSLRGKPGVLRKQEQCDPDHGKPQDRLFHPQIIGFIMILHPIAGLHQHIVEYRHGDGGNDIPQTQGKCKPLRPTLQILNDPGDQMK